MMHAFPPLVRAFDTAKFSVPHVYPARIEIGQKLFAASKLYRTVHGDFMTLKCTVTVLTTRRSSTVEYITPTFSLRDGCPVSVS